jgi:Putative Actinobacterial Holin-X, holin superfamily III
MQEPSNGQGWIDLLRSLGQSLLDVLRAEAEALGVDLRRSAVHLGRGVALIGGAAAVLFWTLGIAVLTLIALLAIWLPVWAAALIVAALFAGTAALLLFLAWRQLRQLANPLEDIRRRVGDHLDWWQNRLLAVPETVPYAAQVTVAVEEGPAAPRIHPDDPLEEEDL